LYVHFPLIFFPFVEDEVEEAKNEQKVNEPLVEKNSIFQFRLQRSKKMRVLFAFLQHSKTRLLQWRSDVKRNDIRGDGIWPNGTKYNNIRHARHTDI
jgi:hypothetical protein